MRKCIILLLSAVLLCAGVMTAYAAILAAVLILAHFGL